MSALPPVLLQLVRDVRDRRATLPDLRVWVVASQHLDFEEFRPLKLLSLAHEMRLDPSHVARSMRNLVRLGYLHRDVISDSDGARTVRYRLPFSQRVVSAATSRTPQGA